ncbi:Hypothetical predicted protein [Paramuricea clavata]|uniref:Uncharacterized protein n=1 Tax=Paramuricea clavata TaxID=317549 RepID=A0A6S7K067_PARCT|nr:Hypothetical predicted protein [Paramuricea clavata]
MDMLDNESTNNPPKAAYHAVQKKNGGIIGASSISDLPRNRAQAKYFRHRHNDMRILNKNDSVLILLEQCKRQQIERYVLPFIREVTGAPELRCILPFDWQLNDLAAFCSDPAQFYVFGVDPTFNLGLFNVTDTSFKNLKVVDRKIVKLVSLNKDVRGILAHGTDGEEELFNALSVSFLHALHLRCFIHFRENCKEKLRSSNLPEQVQKEYLADIFGRRVGNVWEQGLVDAKDANDFERKLGEVKESWKGMERKGKAISPKQKSTCIL